MRRLVCWVVGSVIGSVLLSGCAGELSAEDMRAAEAYGAHDAAGHGQHGVPATTAPPRPTRYYTWKELASTTGCEAKLQGRTSDFRQAVCVLEGDSFLFLDFDTDRGMRDWLDSAMVYGGVYLVGERWVLSGRSREYMEDELLPDLGGQIRQDTSQHGA